MTDVTRHNNFNLLRLTAALMVLVSHSFGLLNKGLHQPIFPLADSRLILSDLGLYIFFTISGYLVYKSLITSPSYLNYFWKRFLRIVPALAVVNLACIVLGLFITNLSTTKYLSDIDTWRYFLINTSLVANQFHLPGVFTTLPDTSVNSSIWSILLEVKFYIALMFALMVGILKNRWLVLLCFVAMQIAGFYLMFNNISILFINTDIYLTFGSYFIVGVLFACFPKLLEIHWLIPLAILVLAFVFQSVFSQLLMTVSFPYFILKAGLSKPLFGIHKADYSYGFYVYAFPIQQTLILIFGLGMPVFVHIILSSALALGFGIISWHYIEKPFLKKKDALQTIFNKKIEVQS
jgi:peptidoglycan/LPS O-acetylase OafA/YrhL